MRDSQQQNIRENIKKIFETAIFISDTTITTMQSATKT
jgi:hypothetical protein